MAARLSRGPSARRAGRSGRRDPFCAPLPVEPVGVPSSGAAVPLCGGVPEAGAVVPGVVVPGDCAGASVCSGALTPPVRVGAVVSGAVTGAVSTGSLDRRAGGERKHHGGLLLRLGLLPWRPSARPA